MIFTADPFKNRMRTKNRNQKPVVFLKFSKTSIPCWNNFRLVAKSLQWRLQWHSTMSFTQLIFKTLYLSRIVEYFSRGGGGGAVLPYISSCINVFVFQLQMNSREREVSKIYHSSWILPILDFEFVTDAKLNYDTTKGLKTGVENGIFWSEIGSVFGEPGGTPLPRISRSTPPRAIFKHDFLFSLKCYAGKCHLFPSDSKDARSRCLSKLLTPILKPKTERETRVTQSVYRVWFCHIFPKL